MKSIYIKCFSALLLLLSVTLTSCKQDSPEPPKPVNYSFEEGFDSLSVAYAKGWVGMNRSMPLGTASWVQGTAGGKGVTFIGTAASNYSGQDCIYSSFNAGDGVATLSNWLFTPSTNMKNGDKFSFFTRTTVNPASFPDRLQVRLNPIDDNTNISNTTATAVGDYTNLLLDINPTLTTTAYPATWTQYTVTVSGLTGLSKHRLAFRYFVTNGGTAGANSDGIGLDEIKFTSLQ